MFSETNFHINNSVRCCWNEFPCPRLAYSSYQVVAAAVEGLPQVAIYTLKVGVLFTCTIWPAETSIL